MTSDRTCRCGCGEPTTVQSWYASDACRARYWRARKHRELVDDVAQLVRTAPDRLLYAGLSALEPGALAQLRDHLSDAVEGHSFAGARTAGGAQG